MLLYKGTISYAGVRCTPSISRRAWLQKVLLKTNSCLQVNKTYQVAKEAALNAMLKVWSLGEFTNTGFVIVPITAIIHITSRKIGSLVFYRGV